MPDSAYWQTFFNPTCIVSRLDCRGDVIEFGCGYGLFTIPAAASVTGTVYALDIDPKMVAATAENASSAGLKNVVAQVHDFLAAGCGRPDASVTHAMLYNILHIEEPHLLLREAFRALARAVPSESSTGSLTQLPRAVLPSTFDRRPSNAARGQKRPGSDTSAAKICAAAPGTGDWLWNDLPIKVPPRPTNVRHEISPDTDPGDAIQDAGRSDDKMPSKRRSGFLRVVGNRRACGLAGNGTSPRATRRGGTNGRGKATTGGSKRGWPLSRRTLSTAFVAIVSHSN
ncbi:class I SAM-dependent methyltransferase [Fimbriiglobus ruber]|uniref:class I SAM-dependent methyltransferase n=1 Tax=Fimbriiglobus ruber TaxID=1908690 RepID=UPI003B848B47